MRGIAAELQNVPLRNAHVLDELPRRVRKMIHFLIDKLNGKIIYDFIEADMRAASAEQVQQMLA